MEADGMLRQIVALFVATAVLVLIRTSSSAELQVPGEYSTIQSAIDTAVNGDTVIIAPGTYTGDSNRDIDFKGKAITVRSTDPNDSVIVATTIIDCQNYGRGFTFESGEQADSILKGITIINGKAGTGGGILIRDSSPVIAKCTVSNNSGVTGGGVYCDGGSPTIVNSIIENNYASGEGGGIYYWGSGKPSIINCTVRGNSTNSRGEGGGIYINGDIHGGQPTISFCSIIENTAGSGGGLYIHKSSPLISHCTVADNYAVGSGGLFLGGMGSPDEYTVRVEHCRITGNSANSKGGLKAICCNLYMYNCVVSGNSSYGYISGGLSIESYSTAEIRQCTIVGNRVAQIPGQRCVGGGLFLKMCDVTISNSIIRQNRATEGAQLAIHAWDGVQSPDIPPINEPTLVTLLHNDFAGEQDQEVYIYGEPNRLTLEMYSNLDVDPCFADAGWWDPNGTQDDPNDDFWVEGDYHLKSQAGRWDANEGRWTKDDVTSACIDAGDVISTIGFEPFPNGGIINMGAFGGTAEASKSYFGEPVCETIIAGDINGDCKVDFRDFVLMAYHWHEDNSP